MPTAFNVTPTSMEYFINPTYQAPRAMWQITANSEGLPEGDGVQNVPFSKLGSHYTISNLRKISVGDQYYGGVTTNVRAVTQVCQFNCNDSNRFVNGVFRGACADVFAGFLTGPQGLAGPIGDAGLQGPQGANAVAGATGPQGPKGDLGPTGPQALGAVGPTGPVGPKGARGIQGTRGPTGPQGVTGEQGECCAGGGGGGSTPNCDEGGGGG